MRSTTSIKPIKSMALACALLLLMAIAAFGPWQASACGCGEFKGFVVASGESPHGVPWLIEASHPRTDSLGRRGVEFYFHSEPPAPAGSGYFKGMGLPIPKRFVFSAISGSFSPISGSEIDPYAEGDLSGVTGSRVATLVATMSNGEELTIEPQLAPSRLRARFPWLRRLRFFDHFYTAGLRPLKLAAFGSAGNLIAARSADRGFFAG